MKRPLRALLIEDDPNDELLLVDELVEAGFDLTVERVETEAGLRAALTTKVWDFVFSDYAMPRFDGFEAFRVFREFGLDVPFVMVSGTLGEENAVAAMRLGMDDYVLKDRRGGVTRAVERALGERARNREAVQARRLAEDRLAVVLEQLPAVVWTTNRELRIDWLGGAGLEGTGATSESLVGVAIRDLWDDAETARVPVEVHQGALAGKTGTFEVSWELRTFQVHVRPLRDGTAEVVGALAVAFDVTEVRRLSRQFQVAQRMESIGRLAGGVAHDFNNILGVILGAAELVRDDLSETGRAQRELDQLEQAAGRGARLCRQLLAYGRRQILRPEVTDVNELLGRLRAMLERMIGERYELVLRGDPTVSRVEIDAGQVEQVVMNLVINARDAMADGGRILVETRDVEHDEEYVAVHAGSRVGRFVEIAVTDTGHGMDPATMDRIFEPFFSTKEEDRGTGLGLASVYGIVKQSEGEIRVYSELHCGTTFRIYFPASGASLPRSALAAPPTGDEKEAPVQDVSGTETILVCEDEEDLREITRLTLERRGYTVLEAATPAAALEIMGTEGVRVDLLISDVVMAGMSGVELVARLRETSPALRVILTSGYTEAAVFPADDLQVRDVFLTKPVRPKDLAAAVRALLDRPS